MPTPEPILGRRVLAHIEAHPNTWNQGIWAMKTECGTTYCFAGHAVAMAHPGNAEFLFGDETLDDFVACRVTISGQSGVTIQEQAATDLGLRFESALVLFSPSNTLEHLRQYVEQMEDADFAGRLRPVNPAWDSGDGDDV